MQKRDKFQDSNRTPCHFKGEKIARAAVHVSAVDKVGCYGGETRQSLNHFKILHAGKRLTEAGRRQRAGERNQNSVTGISPVCFVIVPLGSPCLLGAHGARNCIYQNKNVWPREDGSQSWQNMHARMHGGLTAGH